jgi:hypothetical protein
MKEAVAAALLLLHGPDGHTVLLNPEQIVALHSKKQDKGEAKLFVPGAECLVNTADGKYIAVVEVCSTIRDALERRQ